MIFSLVQLAWKCQKLYIFFQYFLLCMLQFSIKFSYILQCILNHYFKSHSQSYHIDAAYCIATQQSNDSYCTLHLILKWSHSFQARLADIKKKQVSKTISSRIKLIEFSFLWFHLIFFGLIQSACIPSLYS
jgi:hypothetical protein